MSLVDYAVTDAVATITLNRPPVNALNSELISDIDAAVAEAEDPSVRAASARRRGARRWSSVPDRRSWRRERQGPNGAVSGRSVS